ncbi:MAG: hypothetical protein H7X80_07965 [bacterium]|nr:hypothetical protein [Candidatus Kapabacteria bacterium]
MHRPRRYRLWRLFFSLLAGVALWAIVSLNGTYSWTLDVPLRIELPVGHALVDAVPSSLGLTIRTDGWSLLSLMVARKIEAVLKPRAGSGGERVYFFDRTDLLRSIRTTVSTGQLVSIAPDTLMLRLGPVKARRVPLLPNASISTRPGFMVVGPVRVVPDSIRLTGSARVLPSIASWTTAHTQLTDVFAPVSRAVDVVDSIPGVVQPGLRIARIVADVQEVAERSFPDIPVFNRSAMRDTNLKLVLHPPRITVMVRGGARDLSRLSPTDIRAYVNVVEGADTFGVAQPIVVAPHGSYFTVVEIAPKRVRYLWRRGD